MSARRCRLSGLPLGPMLLLATSITPAAVSGQHVEDLAVLQGRAAVRVNAARAGFEELAWASAGAPGAQRSALAAPVTGTLTVLLVPALFSDSPQPITADGPIRELFFGTAPGSGDLSRFFDEASGGLLQATGEITPWYRTSVPWEQGTGGASSVFGIGPEFGRYLLEAIAAADSIVDFGQFDNDGPDGVPNSGDDNGFVDALSFLFTEPARSCAGPGVWPHKSGLSPRNGGQPYTSNDLSPAGTPIQADGYVVVSASACDGAPLTSVGVIAHELGHELGLPDLYHPIGEGIDRILSVNRRWVVGCFGLMAAGSWGCGAADKFPLFGPTHFSAWSRWRLGWIDLIRAESTVHQEFVLQPAQSSQQVLWIPMDANEDEVLLAEYRPAVGFDQGLPASGVLLYRMNQGGALRPDPPDTSPYYHIRLEEGDGNHTLVRTHAEGGNRGEASDVFATEGTTRSVTNLTSPSSRLADGSVSTVTIHSIETDGNVARIVVSTAPTAQLALSEPEEAAMAFTPYGVAVPAGGGALPYTLGTVSGGVPDGLALRVEGDRVWIEGTPLSLGSATLTVRLRDARALVGTSTLLIRVTPIPTTRLFNGLWDSDETGLTPTQRQLLDGAGNADGAYDIGDLRAHALAGG